MSRAPVPGPDSGMRPDSKPSAPLGTLIASPSQGEKENGFSLTVSACPADAAAYTQEHSALQRGCTKSLQNEYTVLAGTMRSGSKGLHDIQ